MAHLNPDAPAFDPTKFGGGIARSGASGDGESAPTPTSSFKPNPDAPAFKPNPDAPAYQPKPSIPVLGGYKLRVPPGQSTGTPGSPPGVAGDSPHLPGERPRFTGPPRVGAAWNGAAGSPSLSATTPGTPSAPYTSANLQTRRTPPQPGTPDPSAGSHFTVNASDTAAPQPPRGWQPPHAHGNSFGHAAPPPTGTPLSTTSASPLSAPPYSSPRSQPSPLSPPQTQSSGDSLGPVRTTPAAAAAPAPSPPTSTPPKSVPSKAMTWVPPQQKLIPRLSKGAAALAPAPAQQAPTEATAPADDVAPAEAIPSVPSPPTPSGPKAITSPKAVAAPPGMKAWVPPHQRHLPGKAPVALSKPTEVAAGSAPAAPPNGEAPQGTAGLAKQPAAPALTPEQPAPVPAPHPRIAQSAIPPRISSAPMAKGAGVASLRPTLSLGPKKGAIAGLPSRPPVPPGPAPAPQAHTDPTAETAGRSPSTPAPVEPGSQTTPAPQSPPAAGAAAPQQAAPLGAMGAPSGAQRFPGSLVKGPPMPTPGGKMWQPPQYARRPLSAATSPSSAAASAATTAPAAPTGLGVEAARPAPPQLLSRPPMHHHHHHHLHHHHHHQPPVGTLGSLHHLTSAPSYVPTSWQPPQRNQVTLPQAQPTPENPLVVLIYGCRGAGKTTQATALANRYNLLCVSSGKWFKEDKRPFEELRATVRREFGPGVPRRYNGIVLDRFIVTSDIDAYYIQSALREGNLPVPMTVWLKVTPEIGMQRADARGDDKVANTHWRAVEQRAQAAAANHVYSVIGSLETIETDHMSEENVAQAINRYIDLKFPLRSRNIRLPEKKMGDQYISCPLLERHEDFLELTKAAHFAVGNTTGRTDSAPLSTIGGYVDRSYFAFGNRHKRSVMMSAQVTLKADGQRFLVGKHKKFGFVGFPFLFQSVYDFNEFFVDMPFAECWDLEGVSHDDNAPQRHGFEFLLDCELVVDDVHGAVIHVIDFIYFYGMRGKKPQFQARYTLLQDWFLDMRDNSPIAEEDQPVQLKLYVPVSQLADLLPSLDQAPFPIDGLVFQHPNGYRYGMDKLLLKWKPQEMCTADFRLANGRRLPGDPNWHFDLFVSDASDQNGLQEVAFPNAVAIFSAEEVTHFKLHEGMIVELALFRVDSNGANSGHGGQHAKGDRGAPSATVWQYHRVREDKPTPNKLTIVKEIVDLQHLKYPELLQLCSDLDAPSSK